MDLSSARGQESGNDIWSELLGLAVHVEIDPEGVAAEVYDRGRELEACAEWLLEGDWTELHQEATALFCCLELSLEGCAQLLELGNDRAAAECWREAQAMARNLNGQLLDSSVELLDLTA